MLQDFTACKRALEGDEETKFTFLLPIVPLAPEMSQMAGPPDSTGGCQRCLC
jgi:hypothetical protein